MSSTVESGGLVSEDTRRIPSPTQVKVMRKSFSLDTSLERLLNSLSE
jgi:hypothetical protein